MSKTNAGIDYGRLAGSNRNKDTGIHYGVISEGSLGAWIYDIINDCADYGQPTCPKCQRQADEPSAFGESFKDGRPDDYTDEEFECDDYVCVECKHFFGSESAFSDEMIGWAYDKDGYKLKDCLQNDVFVIESPYYTYAEFCSPCVPGAGNLDSPLTIVRPTRESFACTMCAGTKFMQKARWNCLSCGGHNCGHAYTECMNLDCRASKHLPRIYCLGHDWFEDGKAPYRVFKVSDGSEVLQ